MLPPPPAKVDPLGETPAIDPTTGWQISPMVAASLCMKPTPTLTPSEAAKVGALKEASPSFVVMRRLAMRFRGLLQAPTQASLTVSFMTPDDLAFPQCSNSQER